MAEQDAVVRHHMNVPGIMCLTGCLMTCPCIRQNKLRHNIVRKDGAKIILEHAKGASEINGIDRYHGIGNVLQTRLIRFHRTVDSHTGNKYQASRVVVVHPTVDSQTGSKHQASRVVEVYDDTLATSAGLGNF